jgi:hypothetical protein
MHKLNLDMTEVLKSREQKEIEKHNSWASPIGWWSVSTEGDEEGRSTSALGSFHGHIAEIALHLSNKCFYSLRFVPGNPGNPPATPNRYSATALAAQVSFGNNHSLANQVKCPFDQARPDERQVQRWMNAEGIEVTGSNYYGAVVVKVR